MSKLSKSLLKTISILGSGWLGLPLAEHFIQQGYVVKASTRSIERSKDIEAIGAKSFVVDIDQSLAEIGEFFDSDILLVNITSKNIEGYYRLINEIEKALVRKVIYVSSTSVYQNTNSIVTEGECAENEANPFYQIENLFRSNEYFQTTVIRFAGLIGYSRHPGRFFGDRKIPQPEAPVNLIHRDDCIAIIDGIVKQEVWGEVFNACADTHPSKREFYSYARKSLGVAPPEFDEPNGTGYKIISNEKIKQALGYDFIHADLINLDL